MDVSCGSRSGGTSTLLYPLYHPAAALYMPAMRTILEEDFARIPSWSARAGHDAPGAYRASRPLAAASPGPAPHPHRPPRPRAVPTTGR